MGLQPPRFRDESSERKASKNHVSDISLLLHLHLHLHLRLDLYERERVLFIFPRTHPQCRQSTWSLSPFAATVREKPPYRRQPLPRQIQALSPGSNSPPQQGRPSRIYCSSISSLYVIPGTSDESTIALLAIYLTGSRHVGPCRREPGAAETPCASPNALVFHSIVCRDES